MTENNKVHVLESGHVATLQPDEMKQGVYLHLDDIKTLIDTAWGSHRRLIGIDGVLYQKIMSTIDDLSKK